MHHELLPEFPAPGWAMWFYQTASDHNQEHRSYEKILLDLDLLGRKIDTAFKEGSDKKKQKKKPVDSGIISGKSWTESSHSVRKLMRVRRDASQAWLVFEYPM